MFAHNVETAPLDGGKNVVGLIIRETVPRLAGMRLEIRQCTLNGLVQLCVFRYFLGSGGCVHLAISISCSEGFRFSFLQLSHEIRSVTRPSSSFWSTSVLGE